MQTTARVRNYNNMIIRVATEVVVAAEEAAREAGKVREAAREAE